jgi:peroxiredoxin
MSSHHYSLILKDFRSKTVEIVGISTDELKLDALVCEMLDAGMNVMSDRLNYPDFLREDILDRYQPVFQEEPGLLARLQEEYHQRTERELTYH